MSARLKGIAEALGMIGIVLSLLFVGYEVRQANQLARLQVQQEQAAQWRETNIAMATSPDLVAALARVFEGATESDFSPEENVTLRFTYWGAIQAWQGNFKQLQLGILSPDDIIFPDGTSRLFNSAYLRELWPDVRRDLSEDFAQFWESRYGLLR